MVSEKNDSNHTFLIPDEGDELDEIMKGLLELKQRHGNIEIDPKHVLELIDDYYTFTSIFKNRTSKSENFFTLADIEALFRDYKNRVTDTAFRNLLDSMSNLKGESDLIKKKKEEYLQKGIRLKNFHAYTSSILTIDGRVSFKRMALRPSSRVDGEKLSATGHKSFVFPVDEALELTKLPFNMAISAMLMVAKMAVRTNSYEEAEDMLREYASINVNDDTIRKVTNSLGTMVYRNDLKVANANWEQLTGSKLIFPDEKRPYVLYLLTDGAMLPTREKDEKGSIWRENKLGIAFSTDYFTFWVDKHGERQHRIDKREFVNYIGQSEEFKRFMFSLALRNGYGLYREVILLSDGATWIRNMKEELFPDAQQILDFYHLCENISNYAKSIFSLDEKLYKPWAKEVCDLLKESKTNEALKIIRTTKIKKRNNTALNICQYIQNNIDNIDYANYIKKGYFIGSGAVESANKYVLQERLKRPGMRWEVANGQAIASLRAKLKSGLWERDVVQASYQYYGVRPTSKLALM
jgi:hypothetical protein